METQKLCPNCRKPLPPDVPLGLCPECLIKSGFPTGTEPGATGEAAGMRFVPPPVEEIAQLFPQLEIIGLIGKGGMGAVYKARQPALDRFVALKVLPPAVANDPGFAERFNREARALARLNHPNIVAVHDFGKAGPLHYLVMEFVDGTNLREVEHAGRLSPEQALAIVPQICEALQFAHNEGIVHRDIKPENLLMDKKGRVKITDFGIAKIVGVPAGKVSLTGAKDVVGTPHYMAPEQIEKPQTVDHRADIYSLGVVFYEMLTGELPLGKFQPPSSRMGGVQIDVRLDEVVLHTLEKEPERRYQQVSQLKTDVETIAGTVPSTAGFGAKGGSAPLLATPASKVTSDKINLPACLLAFFFGPFGAHRFYVGKIWTGIAQLGALGGCILMIIACGTTGARWQPTLGILLGVSIFGCVIWAIIEWILILCKAFTDGQGRRITNWLHPQNGNVKNSASPVSGPQPSLKKFWPGPVVIALTGALIVMGMFLMYWLIVAVALSHHHMVGEKPDLTTGVDTTNDDATRGIVMSATAAVPPPVRIKAGSFESLMDSDGNLWLPDQGFAGGNTAERSQHLAIVNTSDPGLYRSERYDMRSFSYPVPNGKYIVKLHFAETNGRITGPGKRVFTFVVGNHEFKDFDVWTEAGGAQRACIKTVNVEVTDGRLNIYFIRQQEKPEINGIEILPVSPPAAPVMPTSPKPTHTLATAQNQPGAPREKVIGNLSTSDPFQQDFHQTLPANGRLRLDNVNGRVEIAGWDRNEVDIKALKHGKTRESVDAVQINVTSNQDGITIHSEQPSGGTGFLEFWSWIMNGGDKKATVDYAIQVPRNTRLKGISSVNGRIMIEDVNGDIEASTVNGTTQVKGAAGDLKLSTVNGRVTAELTSLGHGQAVSLNGVNGEIEAILPADANAEVTANTVNGSITSEFPALVVQKEFPVSKKLKGTLGSGSASVKISTVNGGIRIRKGSDAK